MKHRHHIVPRHAGGDDSPENIATLTVEEHAQAHLDRWNVLKEPGDLIAYRMLSGQITSAEATRLAGIEANLGRKLSDETRRKMSLANRKRQESPTARMVEGWAKSAATRRGKQRPPEVVARVLEGLKEHWKSPEARQRASESAKARATDEVRAKLRKARASQVIQHSAETRKKLSESWTPERRKNNPLKGRPRSPEVRAKISASKMGHVVSEATRQKMSEARKARQKEGVFWPS